MISRASQLRAFSISMNMKISQPARSKLLVPVAQLDKASDYESEDWGFKSLQGYVFFFFRLRGGGVGDFAAE